MVTRPALVTTSTSAAFLARKCFPPSLASSRAARLSFAFPRRSSAVRLASPFTARRISSPDFVARKERPRLLLRMRVQRSVQTRYLSIVMTLPHWINGALP